MIYSSPFPDVRIPEVPLVDFVLANAAAHAGKVALIDGLTGRAVSYGGLAEEIHCAAAGLADGIRSGDVVAIFGPNSPEYVTSDRSSATTTCTDRKACVSTRA